MRISRGQQGEGENADAGARAGAGAQGEADGAEQRGAKRGEASAEQRGDAKAAAAAEAEADARDEGEGAEQRVSKRSEASAAPPGMALGCCHRCAGAGAVQTKAGPRPIEWACHRLAHPNAAASPRMDGFSSHLHVVGRVDEPCCGYPKATGSGLFLEAVPVVAGTTLGSGGTTRWCACAVNGVIEAVPSARAHAGSFCGNLAQLGSTGRLAGLPWPSPRSWPAPGAAAKQQAGANASAIGRPSEYYRLPVSERLGLPEARRIVAPRAARCTKFGNLVGL